MTKKIVIKYTTAEHDCETCGGTWEESYQLLCKDVVIGNEAHAYCFGCENTSLKDALMQFLEHEGYKIEFDGDYYD
jgi:hypothetical protein